MPSTSTSRPPLLTLVTLASTIRPLRRFSQLASTAAPLRLRIRRPSSVSKWSTTDLDHVADVGEVGRRTARPGRRPRSWRRGRRRRSCPGRRRPSPSATPAGSPGRRPPWRTWARSAARVRGPALPTSSASASKPAIAASSSASRSASHCRLNETSRLGLGRPAVAAFIAASISSSIGFGRVKSDIVGVQFVQACRDLREAGRRRGGTGEGRAARCRLSHTERSESGVDQFQGRPEARVLADREVAADGQEPVLASRSVTW